MPAKPWLKIPHSVRSLLALTVPLLAPPTFAQTQTLIFPVAVTSQMPAISGAAIGNFNGDGLPDEAYITPSYNPPATSITVLLNNGPYIAPTPVVTSGLTCTPQSLVAGDMNKDGKLDLVFTCTQGYIVVMFGNGNGTFQSLTSSSYQTVANVNAITLQSISTATATPIS